MKTYKNILPILFFLLSSQHALSMNLDSSSSASLLTIGTSLCEEKQMHNEDWQMLRAKFHKSLESKPWGNLAKKYITELKQEEQELLDNFIGIFPGLTHENWLEHKQNCAIYKSDWEKQHLDYINQEKNSELPNQLYTLAKKNCDQIGIDPNRIKIISGNEKKSMAMITLGSTIILNKKICLNKSIFDNDDKFHACFTHEIQHLLHEDFYIRCCMEHLYELNKSIINQQTYEEFRKKSSYFHEKRADILAVLTHPDYAKAGADGFEKFAHQPLWIRILFFWIDFDNMFEETHPACSVRASYMKKIHSEMLEAIEKK